MVDEARVGMRNKGFLYEKSKKLNFGCGKDIRKDFLNVDIQGKADKLFNFNKFPYPLKDNRFDYVFINLVLEFCKEPTRTLLELRKKCKNKAIIEIECVYWNSFGLWSDPYAIRGFNDEYFKHLADENKTGYWKTDTRKLFKIKELKLIPTHLVGRFMPKRLREELSKFISGMISHVHVKMEVVK